MRTIDESTAEGATVWGLLWRDLRLLLRIGKMLLVYWVVGRRIRQAYRAKEARGEVYWVDEEGGR